jgi:hypothetical protein
MPLMKSARLRATEDRIKSYAAAPRQLMPSAEAGLKRAARMKRPAGIKERIVADCLVGLEYIYAVLSVNESVSAEEWTGKRTSTV